MSSLETFDGLCGMIYIWATSDQQVRCKYEFAHAGPHSYEASVLKGGCCSSSGPNTIKHPIKPFTQN